MHHTMCPVSTVLFPARAPATRRYIYLCVHGSIYQHHPYHPLPREIGTAMRTNDRPNVLVIVPHDQGIGASCYAGAGQDGLTSLQTPNENWLAEHGTLLKNHHGTAPMCSPARGTLYTGLYPHQNGLYGLTHRGHQYNEGITTIAHHLSSHGYVTAVINGQHESPQDRLKELGGYQEIYLPWTRGVKTKEGPETIEWGLRELARVAKDNRKPFFASIMTNLVHLPWGFGDLVPDLDAGDPLEIPSYLPECEESVIALSQFHGAVARFDRDCLGLILRILKEEGLVDTTIVCKTTDHGIAHPGSKGLLYDPGCHVGMIFSGPGILQGRKLDALASTIDFARTICDLCHVPPHPQFSGASYASLLTDPRAGDGVSAIHDYIFTENTFSDKYNPIRSVRTPGWRYIRNYVEFPVTDGPPQDVQKLVNYIPWVEHVRAIGWAGCPRPKEELYDVKADPDCRTNLAYADPPPPALLELRHVLDEHLERTGDPIRKGPCPLPPMGSTNNAWMFPHLWQDPDAKVLYHQSFDGLKPGMKLPWDDGDGECED